MIAVQSVKITCLQKRHAIYVQPHLCTSYTVCLISSTAIIMILCFSSMPPWPCLPAEEGEEEQGEVVGFGLKKLLRKCPLDVKRAVESDSDSSTHSESDSESTPSKRFSLDFPPGMVHCESECMSAIKKWCQLKKIIDKGRKALWTASHSMICVFLMEVSVMCVFGNFVYGLAWPLPNFPGGNASSFYIEIRK